MSDHETPHLDDDGVCQCECPACLDDEPLISNKQLTENDNGMWCTCPDCDVIACGMHGIPTA